MSTSVIDKESNQNYYSAQFLVVLTVVNVFRLTSSVRSQLFVVRR